MNRIKSIKFKNHPVLGDLSLDFTDDSGNAVDTVIFAGENGTGKSTVLNALYALTTGRIDYEAVIEVITNAERNALNLKYRDEDSSRIVCTTNTGSYDYPSNSSFLRKYNLNGIFSDVDINFNSEDLRSVTSLDIDSISTSRRSTNDLPQQINQLIIDIQALDDAAVSKAFREAKEEGQDTNALFVSERMPRFTNAFNYIFSDLKYDRVENIGGHKAIIFKKNGVDVPVSNLSSGEKQIVYRGSFLLKDINAMNGAYVFIDEPEISMHPAWHEKIMEYYKRIFTAENGVQTSQIFAVTHSPFIIHNSNRNNDKVIILTRDASGKIVVSDKSSYYKCNSIEAVEDAFSVTPFSKLISDEKGSVFLEGRTDEKYFNKAVEVFNYKDYLPFDFKWIGYIDENGQERNTGCSALNNALNFLTARNYPIKNACLFDCDTGKPETIQNNVLSTAIPTFENSKGMKKGIENALVLDDVTMDDFYITETKQGDYGESKTISTFDKMKFCDYVCSETDNEELKVIFANLKTQIDKLIPFFSGE